MGSVVQDIGGAISGGINAVSDLAKGDVGGALSTGLGAVANGFLAMNPEIGEGASLLGPLSGMLSGLTGGSGGGGGLGQAGQLPGMISGLLGNLGGALQNPMQGISSLLGGGGLAGLLGGGSSSNSGLGGIFQGIAAGGTAPNALGAATAGTGLPSVGGTQSSVQGQLAGLLGTQEQEAQFQIQFQEISSLIEMLKECGKTAAQNMS